MARLPQSDIRDEYLAERTRVGALITFKSAQIATLTADLVTAEAELVVLQAKLALHDDCIAAIDENYPYEEP